MLTILLMTLQTPANCKPQLVVVLWFRRCERMSGLVYRKYALDCSSSELHFRTLHIDTEPMPSTSIIVSNTK